MLGDEIRKDRNHVVLEGGTIADKSVPELQEKAKLYDLSGMADSGMNKVKLCAVDALFNDEGEVVDELNDFLATHPYGPYDHLSEAWREVQNLYKKKDEKAEVLNALLQQFAESCGVNKYAFEQLPALMKLMRQRNKFAHPYDPAYLVSEIEKGNSDLSSVSDVLSLVVKRKRANAAG